MDSCSSDRAVLREPEAAVRDRAQAPKERPILFSGAMVRALLVGTKTQTRRPLKVQPIGTPFAGQASLNRSMTRPVFYAMWETRAADGSTCCICPYGVPGDRLWVRETFSGPYCMEAQEGIAAAPPSKWGLGSRIWYWADGDPTEGDWTRPRPSIHMPRWASRITLEVTGVRVERLQDISEADAIAEGIEQVPGPEPYPMWRHYGQQATRITPASSSYGTLWEQINGPGSWEANPWVWVIEFRQTASGSCLHARSNSQDQSNE